MTWPPTPAPRLPLWLHLPPLNPTHLPKGRVYLSYQGPQAFFISHDSSHTPPVAGNVLSIWQMPTPPSSHPRFSFLPDYTHLCHPHFIQYSYIPLFLSSHVLLSITFYIHMKMSLFTGCHHRYLPLVQGLDFVFIHLCTLSSKDKAQCSVHHLANTQ